MKRIFFFSLIFLFFIQFGTVWGIGLKLPELPKTEVEIYLSDVDILPLADSSLPASFPNLAEGGGSRLSSGYWSSDLYSKAIMKNKTWDKVKGTWNGPLVNVVTKITTESNNSFLAWMAIHSFVSAITDAKAQSPESMKYFRGYHNWHMCKNLQDIAAAMATVSIMRRVFIERIPLKVFLWDLSEGATLRFVLFNATMKIVKGGFPAYNDPRYNRHSLPYWWFEDGKFTDKYISTNRVTTPLFDGLAIGGFVLMKTWKF